MDLIGDFILLVAQWAHEVLNSNMRLSTLRSYCFALGSWIIEHANQKVLKNITSTKKKSLDGWFV